MHTLALKDFLNNQEMPMNKETQQLTVRDDEFDEEVRERKMYESMKIKMDVIYPNRWLLFTVIVVFFIKVD